MYEVILTENTFANPWYWAVVIIAWVNLLQYSFGISREMFNAARRGDVQAKQDTMALLDVNSRIIITDYTKLGSLLVLLTCFVLSSFAVIGFKNDVYTLQAVVFLGVPIALIGIMGFAYSKKMISYADNWERICRTYTLFWFIKWAIALISITITMFWAVYIEVTAF
ncbi:hypothetical protein F9L33_03075 [Amylibacter sp. SFDW26]|uniref:hypothetical protein n=1 Tax=Amylibacter sp. SFDW26 TaxID=2652722 RepID=UPI001261403D|nr:hypothetical protein [Amylibacter sp. SFDW26]KAB7615758.1 hypothetical protein F9L33_03075 [Amylibacter sp. SFDW26]